MSRNIYDFFFLLLRCFEPCVRATSWFDQQRQKYTLWIFHSLFASTAMEQWQWLRYRTVSRRWTKHFLNWILFTLRISRGIAMKWIPSANGRCLRQKFSIDAISARLEFNGCFLLWSRIPITSKNIERILMPLGLVSVTSISIESIRARQQLKALWTRVALCAHSQSSPENLIYSFCGCRKDNRATEKKLNQTTKRRASVRT